MENIEREKSVFGFYVEELKEGRRQLIQEVVEEQISNIINYFSNKIRQSNSVSPVSKKRIQLKLMKTNSIAQEIMKEFEESIKEIEQLDEEHFRIPANLSLVEEPKFTKEELEQVENSVEELSLQVKHDHVFMHFLQAELKKIENLQEKLAKEKEIFASIDEQMKTLDISAIENLYNQVVDKK